MAGSVWRPPGVVSGRQCVEAPWSGQWPAVCVRPPGVVSGRQCVRPPGVVSGRQCVEAPWSGQWPAVCVRPPEPSMHPVVLREV